jgi:hypothetical protein
MGRVVIELKVIFYAIEKLVLIELLYHVLNDIPLLFTITSSLEG